ncbi:MAG: S8 family serine peptidase, partial [Delftia sp.]|nr:S8 family serine peptidase [Delftia sp.]
THAGCARTALPGFALAPMRKPLDGPGGGNGWRCKEHDVRTAMAQEAAAACYRNAWRLHPRDPRWPYYLDPINQAIMRAWAEGITVVAAAGNDGPEAMTVGSPGNLPYIITVGAVTDSWTLATRKDDYIPDFSSRGPTPEGHIKPDIVAPGGHITGITRPGSGLLKEHPEYQLKGGELVMTGTSQAAALVSGLVALLLQLEPDLTPDDVKCKLTGTAEPAI